jgi:hypothetical protein
MENLNNNEFEVRNIEIRAEQESRKIKGTAIVFNSESENLGGFIEVISPEAVTNEFLDRQDIVLLYNHNDATGVLARSKNGKGTLRYSIDETGVHFEFEAKNTSLGNEVLEAVRSGDLDSCSFAFRLGQNGDSWENVGNGMYKRTINKFDVIRDFSIVVTPAYSATSTEIKYRGLEQLKENELERFKEQEQLEEQNKIEELNNYYSNYDQLIQDMTN